MSLNTLAFSSAPLINLKVNLRKQNTHLKDLYTEIYVEVAIVLYQCFFSRYLFLSLFQHYKKIKNITKIEILWIISLVN